MRCTGPVSAQRKLVSAWLSATGTEISAAFLSREGLHRVFMRVVGTCIGRTGVSGLASSVRRWTASRRPARQWSTAPRCTGPTVSRSTWPTAVSTGPTSNSGRPRSNRVLSACYLWPRLGLASAALRYVIYFRSHG